MQLDCVLAYVAVKQPMYPTTIDPSRFCFPAHYNTQMFICVHYDVLKCRSTVMCCGCVFDGNSKLTALCVVVRQPIHFGCQLTTTDLDTHLHLFPSAPQSTHGSQLCVCVLKGRSIAVSWECVLASHLQSSMLCVLW